MSEPRWIGTSLCVECGYCGGTGREVSLPCPACKGAAWFVLDSLDDLGGEPPDDPDDPEDDDDDDDAPDEPPNGGDQLTVEEILATEQSKTAKAHAT